MGCDPAVDTATADVHPETECDSSVTAESAGKKGETFEGPVRVKTDL